jgi:hypothetical protein
MACLVVVVALVVVVVVVVLVVVVVVTPLGVIVPASAGGVGARAADRAVGVMDVVVLGVAGRVEGCRSPSTL